MIFIDHKILRVAKSDWSKQKKKKTRQETDVEPEASGKLFSAVGQKKQTALMDDLWVEQSLSQSEGGRQWTWNPSGLQSGDLPRRRNPSEGQAGDRGKG